MKQPFSGQVGRQRFESERPIPGRIPVIKAVTNVTNSNVTLWTVTANKFLYIQKFTVCNIAAGAIAVTVYVVPSGGSASNANKVYDAFSVAQNTSVSLTALEGHMLDDGDFIVVVTDTATTGGNFKMWGYEMASGTHA